ncbi:hotdog fold domain-containing protein [Nocardia thailandica]|uniref:Hotdog fold domain-containing protein n=1 Tax=Nocardia thailandica TaxID=257275 RepID=A0ABW6PHZ8_9NOCA
MTLSPPSSTSTTAPLRLWRRLSGSRAGRLAFSAGLWAKAPYFVTALPVVRSAEPGRAVVSAPKWFGVHNHLGTFHAIAACNLAEAAMGIAMEVSTPPTHRWIPKAMNVRYLKKATTDLTATATLARDPAELTEGTELPVDIRIVDRDDQLVVAATITTWVTPR